MNDDISYTLLLTACVDPQGVRVARNDPVVRLRDYVQALRWWLGLPDRRVGDVIFAENSGYPLDALREVAERQNPHGRAVTFLDECDNVVPPQLQYGYAELGMIDAAMHLPPVADPDRRVIKATGRLTFPRVTRLLDRLDRREWDFAGDGRNLDLGHLRKSMLRGWSKVGSRTMTTQLMFFRSGFWRGRLSGMQAEMRPFPERTWRIESVLCDRLAAVEAEGEARVMWRWPVNCQPSGLAAHCGEKRYDAGGQRVRAGFRALARRAMPWLWV